MSARARRTWCALSHAPARAAGRRGGSWCPPLPTRAAGRAAPPPPPPRSPRRRRRRRRRPQALIKAAAFFTGAVIVCKYGGDAFAI
jgi:hypothetical protein